MVGWDERSDSQQIQGHNAMRGALPTSDPGRPTAFSHSNGRGRARPSNHSSRYRVLYYVYELHLNRQEALHLPLQQRARLAHRLLASLDDLSESEVEQV
jgi:hypothetical protein